MRGGQSSHLRTALLTRRCRQGSGQEVKVHADKSTSHVIAPSGSSSHSHCAPPFDSRTPGGISRAARLTYGGSMSDQPSARLAELPDVPAIARLLHDFNIEFDTPSPEPDVLAERLNRLLAGDSIFAVLAGLDPVGVGLVSLRPNVWYTGRVALLDELVVVPPLRGQGIGSRILQRVVEVARELGAELLEINVDEGDVDAQRFYTRHGFEGDGSTSERALYFWRELQG